MDEAVAARVRELVPGAVEKRMFGGIAFLVDGNMAVAASGRGGLMVRVDPVESDELVATTAAERVAMRGRPLRGWLRVPAGDDLEPWVERGVAYARTLPAK
jgi:TfoX/Sxy family transcriptional regulator of competence genes